MGQTESNNTNTTILKSPRVSTVTNWKDLEIAQGLFRFNSFDFDHRRNFIWTPAENNWIPRPSINCFWITPRTYGKHRRKLEIWREVSMRTVFNYKSTIKHKFTNFLVPWIFVFPSSHSIFVVLMTNMDNCVLLETHDFGSPNNCVS